MGYKRKLNTKAATSNKRIQITKDSTGGSSNLGSLAPNNSPAGSGLEGSWKDLPEEIQRIVLANLPMNTIANWQKVSKEWSNQTKSNSFWKLAKQYQGPKLACIPDRIFQHPKSAQILRTIFMKNLLSKSHVVTAYPSGRLCWTMDPGVTSLPQLNPQNPVLVLPPGCRVCQTITLSQVGINPTLLKVIGPIQFVAKARFRFPSTAQRATAIAWMGLSQVNGGRMFKYENMANMSADSDGWNNATVVLETDGSSFRSASNNKLILHVANVKTTQPTDWHMQVADIELFLKVIQHRVSTPKPDSAYGFD